MAGGRAGKLRWERSGWRRAGGLRVKAEKIEVRVERWGEGRDWQGEQRLEGTAGRLEGTVDTLGETEEGSWRVKILGGTTDSLGLEKGSWGRAERWRMRRAKRRADIFRQSGETRGKQIEWKSEWSVFGGVERDLG
mgnify:CR=1 FL=1